MGLRDRIMERLGGDVPIDPEAPVPLGPVNHTQSGVISAALHDAGVRHRVLPWAGFNSRLNDKVVMVVAPADVERAGEVIERVGFRPGRAGRR